MARLTRINVLRLTFVALGILLLLPLAVLKRAVDARISTQSHLRHEVVAERIFDEFERELTRVIERESTRPSNAYDRPTDPNSWAPFVVGYFTVDGQGRRLVTRETLDSSRRATLESQIQGASTAAPAVVPAKALPDMTLHMEQVEKSGVKPKSSPEVLRQLNVGSQRKMRAPSQDKRKSVDPLRDYAY